MLLLLRSYIKPCICPMQRIERALDIYIWISTTEPLLGTFFCFAGSVDVDLGWPLGGLGKDSDFVGQHFRKSPSHGQPLLSSILPVLDLAD